MMENLKPCPFCGEKAFIHRDINPVNIDKGCTESVAIYFVLCGSCSALVSGSSKEKAIEAWNRRTDV